MKILFPVLMIVLLFSACGKRENDTMAVVRIPEVVDYNIHIKPILSDRCFACHGPDKASQKAGLVLYAADSAYAELKENPGHYAIVPGKTEQSEVVKRIMSANDEERMPPVESNLSLNDYEKKLITKWIAQGAVYKPHWSFIPVTKPKVPKIHEKDWVTNPIDNFILAKLETKGWKPEPKASKEKLLRRVTFDITGLPPTIEEIDAFLEDNSENAYERVVDRLLSSVAYAERMTSRWLDIARYADSHGYQVDFYRSMWPWREWVIQAYHKNKPFDEFITWQLAGDLLPNATYEQKLATGFNRNHSINQEGGIIDEEFRVEYVADRTNTLGAALLGLTLECARCHDHKYDPISQKNYYELYSFFNSVPEKGYAGGPAPNPSVKYPKEKLDTLRNYLAKISTRQSEILQKRKIEVHKAPMEDEKFVTWLKNNQEETLEVGSFIPIPKAYLSFDDTSNPKIHQKSIRKGKYATGYFMEKGLSYNMGEQEFIAKNEPFSISCWLYNKYYLNRMQLLSKVNPTIGNGLMVKSDFRYLQINMPKSHENSGPRLTSKEIIPDLEWAQITITYDGSGSTDGFSLYVNGSPMELVGDLDQPVPYVPKNNSLILSPDGLNNSGIDEIYLFDKALDEKDVQELYHYNPVNVALKKDFNMLDENQKSLLIDQYLYHEDRVARIALRNLDAAAYKKLDVPEEGDLTMMTMAEMPEPNPTFILRRGAYDAPGKEVFPNTPQSILSFDDSLPKNRLGLALWLMDHKNPLTSRVAVNRYWEYIFGRGIVNTIEDFGNQGSLPSHPELLDWLAATFMEDGWDTKAMIKLMVMSSTYQQQSATNIEKREMDQENIFLARGSRYRLPGEMIRDQALLASGLLNKKVGGPGVRPYQPENLWSDVTAVGGGPLAKYVLDVSEDLYRRSLYTFWKRTVPPPAMLTFDAATRDRCIVSRQNTNTPLQALVLMNDPQYMEAARVMAQKLLTSNPSPENNLTLAFRKLTGRQPKPNELEILLQSYQESLKSFSEYPSSSTELLLVGDFPINENLDQNVLAAHTIAISSIMNLDETISKE